MSSLYLLRMAETPTIYQWGGGTEAFERWLERFYDLVEEEAAWRRSSAARSPGSTATTSSPGGSR
jgi:truncated hemoglobin YjbI